MTSKATTPFEPIPREPLQSLYQEFEKAESALRRLYHFQTLNKTQFDARRRILVQKKAHLARLLQLSKEQKNLNELVLNDLHMPSSTQLSTPQLELIDQHLQTKLDHLKNHFRQIKNDAARCKKFLRSPPGLIRTNFLLSKIKKVLQQLQLEDLQLEEKRKKQAAYLTKFYQKFGSSSEGEDLPTLIRLFEHIHQLRGRTSRLSKKIDREERRIAAMEQWLKTKADRIAKDSTKAPSTETILAAKKSVETLDLDPIRYAEKRLTLTRQFIQACQEATGQPSSHPSEAEQNSSLEGSHVH